MHAIATTRESLFAWVPRKGRTHCWDHHGHRDPHPLLADEVHSTYIASGSGAPRRSPSSVLSVACCAASCRLAKSVRILTVEGSICEHTVEAFETLGEAVAGIVNSTRKAADNLQGTCNCDMRTNDVRSRLCAEKAGEKSVALVAPRAGVRAALTPDGCHSSQKRLSE